ncbi:helix-turn-helix transcriptional regulator [Paenibacillus sp. IB182496]|uniref:Helix-turn-helix transcriptional regulator n=1 Tax=Paenibacillus sabuli TaxID=2772509 RepID=A0A927BX54_9BACL|nr:AraC family transcriptional regulator [Paenibacillus sabuli]MBD2847240.1 helix-turn-helix transcriptional regulator [Paenibacillus sabuli]
METELLMCGYSHHTAPFYSDAHGQSMPGYLFRLQTEGAASALNEGKMETIGAGDLLLIGPGDTYRLVIEAQEHPQRGHVVFSSDYYLSCRGTWLNDWWDARQRPLLSRIHYEERLLPLWRMLILERRRLEGGQAELADYLLRTICLTIDRQLDERSAARGRPFIAARLKSYIEEHASRPFSLEEPAAHVGLSVSRISHLFKACYGKTIVEYTQEIRLTIALERLRYSVMTLEQIAESCGFGSYSYFFRVFRKKYGLSPSDYRAAHAPELATGANRGVRTAQAQAPASRSRLSAQHRGRSNPS